MQRLLRVLTRVVFLAIGVLVVVAYAYGIPEKARDTGKSIWYVAFAGDDYLEWHGAPVWFAWTLYVLVWVAVVLVFRSWIADRIEWIVKRLRRRGGRQ